MTNAAVWRQERDTNMIHVYMEGKYIVSLIHPRIMLQMVKKS